MSFLGDGAALLLPPLDWALSPLRILSKAPSQGIENFIPPQLGLKLKYSNVLNVLKPFSARPLGARQ